jgi:hypothetical protein
VVLATEPSSLVRKIEPVFKDSGEPGEPQDVLGLWMGAGGEGAKFWMSVLVGLKNRGVRDVFFLVCDGLERFTRGGARTSGHTLSCKRASFI